MVTTIRRIPHSLKLNVERKVDLDIIKPVDKPTDWVNGLVIVKKPNGTLQIALTLDLLIKQAIKQDHLHLLLRKNFPQISEAKYLSKLGASSGYLQIEVDRKSPNLLTFGTTIGRILFKKLPHGKHSPSTVFQKTVLSIISNIQNSAKSQDCVSTRRKSPVEHDNHLQKVFPKIRESGLKFNKNKCQFCKESLLFFGHIFPSKFIRVDPSKPYPITKIPVLQSLNFRDFCKWLTPSVNLFQILLKLLPNSENF